MFLSILKNTTRALSIASRLAGRAQGRLPLRTSDFEAAMDDGFFPPIQGVRDPDRIITICQQVIRDNGFREDYAMFDGPFSKVLPRRVVWSKKLKGQTSFQNCDTMAHETTHVLQASSTRRWHLKYVTRARFAWVQEAQAYRTTMRVNQAIGVSNEYLRAEAIRIGHSLWDYYPHIRLIRKDHVLDLTRRVLLDSVGL